MRPLLFLLPGLMLLASCGNLQNLATKARAKRQQKAMEKLTETSSEEVAARLGAKAVGEIAYVDDAEVELGFAGGEGLILVDPGAAAAGPAEGEVEAFGGVGFGDWPWRAVVEEHGDVRADSGLNFHAELGGEHHFRAIEVVLKTHTFFGDFA